MLRIGAVTRAYRARDILQKSGISSSVRKLSDREGCVNALLVPEHELKRAQSILDAAGITSQIINER